MFKLLGSDGTDYVMIRKSKQNLAAQKRWAAKRYPRGTVLSISIDPYEPMLKEIRKEGGRTLYLLTEKARWEGVSLMTVLMEWGDPRKWA